MHPNKNNPQIPLLKGIPTVAELTEAMENKKPLFLGVPLAATSDNIKICQLKCKYCFIEQEKHTYQLSLRDHFNIISQFAEMGGSHIKTATVGEPFLDKYFYNPKGTNQFPLIDYANSKKIYWTSFSNLVSITPKIANQLYKKQFSIIGKLNSLDPKIQEKTTGQTGYYDKRNWVKYKNYFIPKYIKYLITAGFNKLLKKNSIIYTRLGVDIIVTKDNYQDIPKVVRFCTENNIYSDIETLEISGEAKSNAKNLKISNRENKWLYRELIPIIGERTLNEERKTVSEFCPLFTAGIVYNIDGSVRLCYNVDSKEKFNLKTNSLEEIYSKMLKIKEKVREKVMLKYKKKKGILNPCPMGIYGKIYQ
jgi:MoaA/NifB/PqqE/SkfB family radical SAM enzyme